MSAATQLVKEHIGVIVTRGLDEYGNFPVQRDEVLFYRVAVDLLLAVTDRIERRDIVTLDPLKPDLITGVFTLNFDVVRSVGAFKSIAKSLYKELEDNNVSDPDTVREYEKYEKLLEEVIGDVKKLLTQSTSEYFGSIDQYGVANSLVDLPSTGSRLLRVNREKDPVLPPRSRLRGKFTDLFNRYVDSKAVIVTGAAEDINAITSDSQIPPPLESVNTDLLTATFIGEGKKIYSDVERLYNFTVSMGGYEGSIIGSVDYQSKYYEYLMAMCYGKVLPQGVLEGTFGNFEQIYNYRSTESEVPGLKFLEPLYTTRSANQTIGISSPVASKYAENGVTDRYVQPLQSNAIDYVSLALESVYTVCLKTGDTVQSILNEDVGDVSAQVKVLLKVFPTSLDVRERSGGVTGSIGSLLKSHRSLYSLTGSEPNLGDLGLRFKQLSDLVSDLIQTLKTSGFRPGGYVPSLDLTYYTPDKEKVESRLKSLGFSQVEIQEITGVSNFLDLIDRFAPLTDSQDVISFFRAYDLTKLLYEYGGQEAIDRYVDFLYGNQPVIRLLGLLDVNRNLTSKVTGSEYSKLIGYLIPLTYAIDPEQLATFDSILKRNNLDLFESISLLIQEGVPTVVKDKNSVSMLSGMVSQMVGFPTSREYKSQQPLWNNLIEKSSGNIGTDISGLYDRADGITPTELYKYLNNPSATSPLGKLLNGVKGGRMTSLLRYCNLFGILYTLSPRNHSGQLVNKSADQFVSILNLVDTLEDLVDRLFVSSTIISDRSDGEARISSSYTDRLVQVQNKEFKSFVDLLGGDIDPDSYKIQESPGIGNSRIPNRVRITNSLSPEEAALVSTQGTSLGIFTQKADESEDGGYVKIAISNLLSNGIDIGAEIVDTSEIGENTDFQNSIPDYRTSYTVPAGSEEVENPSSFNPLESCQRFGTTICNELGYNTDDLCSKGYNKSLYPEDGYGQEPIFTSGTVPIDRPLGDYLNTNTTYSLVPTGHPQQPFSVSGLTSLSRSPLLKDSEMLCAGFKNLLEYGACMNLLKCKRFRPPTSGRYWLEYCPSTLQGGRFKK